MTATTSTHLFKWMNATGVKVKKPLSRDFMVKKKDLMKFKWGLKGEPKATKEKFNE
eukprot:m.308510 g.308510  ORF g.308510 m.308510 type:complete len:56 (-) comp16369_c0_seq32:5186-5353(-)